MAIFHFTAKIISRGKGQSAIAAAAYRSGERLHDEQAGEQKYYTSRAERIQFTDIMVPKDAPEWAHDRNALWNHAERAEKRKDAQLAREIEVSLPHELTPKQREWLVKDFAREAFVRKGYAVDIAIHAPDPESDQRNHHAHLMVTRRTLSPEGFSATKDWQFDTKQFGQWREQWAHLANRHLERHGHEERIDHRSLKEQGIDREATVHLGYAANAMTQRGAQSDRMDELREILARNEIRLDMKALQQELKQLEKAEAAAKQQEASRQRQAEAQRLIVEQKQQRDAAERLREDVRRERQAAAQADELRRQESARKRAAGEKPQGARVAPETVNAVPPAKSLDRVNTIFAAATAEAKRAAEAKTAREATARAEDLRKQQADRARVAVQKPQDARVTPETVNTVPAAKVVDHAAAAHAAALAEAKRIADEKTARAAAAQAEEVRKQEAARERVEAEKIQAARVAAEKAGTAAPAKPIEHITAGHASAEVERKRIAAARAAKDDAFKVAFQETDHSLAGLNANVPKPTSSHLDKRGVRDVSARPDLSSPGNIVVQADKAVGKLAKGTLDLDKGLRVFDRVTGVTTKLTDFIVGFLAGTPASAPRGDTEKFTMDPVERKRQQLARLADQEASKAAEKALARIEDDIKRGLSLKPEDIQNLTRHQQEAIRHFGDSAVRQMVDEAQKSRDSSWQGRERERD